jgi:hypothetical protein
VTHELRRETGVTPTLVYGFNPLIPGICIALLDYYIVRNSTSPIILVINEFDKVTDHACREDAMRFSGEGSMCYAVNKSTLVEFRDLLDSLEHMIIIYTMNSNPIQYEQDPVRGAFFHRSTMQHVFQASSKKKDTPKKKK